MKKAFLFFSNKYLLALGVFLFFMLFFDRNDVFTQFERKQQLNELLQKKEFYVKEIEDTRKVLAELQSNPAALERLARERYFMKKENEDIYLVEN